MLLCKMNYMRWRICSFCKVPNLKVFTLIDGKELAYSSCKPGRFISEVLGALELLSILFISHNVCVVKVKETPFNLGYGILAFVVPYCYWRGKVFIKKTTIRKKKISFHKNLILTILSHKNTLSKGTLCRSLTLQLGYSALSYPSSQVSNLVKFYQF